MGGDAEAVGPWLGGTGPLLGCAAVGRRAFSRGAVREADGRKPNERRASERTRERVHLALVRGNGKERLMPEMEAPKQIRPKAAGDYLEVMSKAAFQAGISWKVVEAKWPGIQKGFRNFDAKKVAKMSPRDIDRLMKDEAVIRNRRKLEAMFMLRSRLRVW